MEQDENKNWNWITQTDTEGLRVIRVGKRYSEEEMQKRREIMKNRKSKLTFGDLLLLLFVTLRLIVSMRLMFLNIYVICYVLRVLLFQHKLAV